MTSQRDLNIFMQHARDFVIDADDLNRHIDVQTFSLTREWNAKQVQEMYDQGHVDAQTLAVANKNLARNSDFEHAWQIGEVQDFIKKHDGKNLGTLRINQADSSTEAKEEVIGIISSYVLAQIDETIVWIIEPDIDVTLKMNYVKALISGTIDLA